MVLISFQPRIVHPCHFFVALKISQQLSAHFHNVAQPSDTMSPVRYSIKMHSVETESIQDPSSIVLSPSGYRPVFQSVLYKSLHDKFHPELSIPGTFLLQHPTQNFHCLQYSLRHKSHIPIHIFVVECVTISAPHSNGRQFTGVAKVLSTIDQKFVVFA